jgi:ATP-dependent Clp protease, protease subunit
LASREELGSPVSNSRWLGVAAHLAVDDIFSRLLKERIVCLYGEVSPRTSATIVAQLLYLEAENPDKPINMYINSPGGSITDGEHTQTGLDLSYHVPGMAIYDTMTYVTPDIVTICMGQAASMGSLLLCAGAPGHRFALPNASIMMHQPSGGYFGQATDVAIHAKEILRVKKRLIETYRIHMTKEHTAGEIESLIERDRFMTADEALEFGLIDGIFTRRGDK